MLRTPVLILYSEVMGYTLASLKHLVEHYPVNVYLVSWDKQKKLTPYYTSRVEGITHVNKSDFQNWKNLLQYAISLKPEIIFVSGWMDKDYRRVTNKCKQQGIKIVSFLDNQWRGTMRQWIVKVFMQKYLTRKYDRLWVTGKKQVAFALRMGFPLSRIFTGSYSADVDFYSGLYEKRNEQIRSHGFPRNITFVGRFSDSKGIDVLLNTFIKNKDRWEGWTITFIGNGGMEQYLRKKAKEEERIRIHGFMSPDELAGEIERTGIFCLPSRFEPWGVVIHEFAAAGIPLITSEVCGANTEFLRENMNGYTFKVNDTDDLEWKLNRLISADTSVLMRMGESSHQLAFTITPATWSATFMKILFSTALQNSVSR